MLSSKVNGIYLYDLYCNSKKIANILYDVTWLLQTTDNYAIEMNHDKFPKFMQALVNDIMDTHIMQLSPNHISINEMGNHKITPIIDNHQTIGPEVLFLIFGNAELEFTKDKKSVTIPIKSGSMIKLTEESRYDWKYRFRPTTRMILMKFTKIIPTMETIISSTKLSELQKGTFQQYVVGKHPGDMAVFFSKLGEMSSKQRKAYLDNFLDIELENLEENFYEGTIETRKSRNDELYLARESSEPDCRLLLWRATIKKLDDRDIRLIIYQNQFMLDFDELRALKQISVLKFRERVYLGFLEYINPLSSKKFRILVDALFDRETTAADIFGC